MSRQGITAINQKSHHLSLSHFAIISALFLETKLASGTNFSFLFPFLHFLSPLKPHFFGNLSQNHRELLTVTCWPKRLMDDWVCKEERWNLCHVVGVKLKPTIRSNIDRHRQIWRLDTWRDEGPNPIMSSSWDKSLGGDLLHIASVGLTVWDC